MKKKSVFLAGILSLICLFAGCAGPAIEEIERIPSSLSLIDAVIAQRMTDATVATPTEIYLVPSGEKAGGDPVFRADRVKELRVRWEGHSQLLIEAAEARVFFTLKDFRVVVRDKADTKIMVRFNIIKYT